MTTLVRLDGEIVATVGARRAFLAPRIEALGEQDPLTRKVLLMAAYALAIRAGTIHGPYSDEAAGFHADSVLARLDYGDDSGR